MLAAPCTNCGRPCPLSVAEPERLFCSACGLEGQTPAPIRESLRAAAGILAREALETRQFDERTRRLLAKAGKRVLASVIFAWLVFLLPLGLALLGGVLLLGQERPSFSLFLFTLAPALVAFVVTWMATRTLARSRVDLERAAAAVPPSVAGEPVRCRVCGAPLAVGAEAVVRCGYCRADNAVSPVLLGRAATVKGAARADIEGAVLEAAGDVNKAARRAALASLAASLGSPVVSFVAIVVVGLTLAAIPTAERTDLDYAVIKGSSGECFALVSTYRDHVRISYGGNAVLGHEDRPSSQGLALVKASFLLGKTVKAPGQPKVNGEVVRIRGALNGTNVAIVRTPSGIEVEALPEGLCLAGR